MHAAPKYSKAEVERRWLVPTDTEFNIASARARKIEDRYIFETRLRLRKTTESGQVAVYKLGKKYEPWALGKHHVVTTYLSETEYQVLARLPARVSRKARYSVLGGALDVYEHPSSGLRIFEVEFASEVEAMAYQPPSGIGQEVTTESACTGYALTSAA